MNECYPKTKVALFNVPAKVLFFISNPISVYGD